MCVHKTFAYGDTPDLSKIYRGKDWVKMFVEPIEDEVAFVWNVSTTSNARACSCAEKRTWSSRKTFCQDFRDPEKRKVKDHCHYTGLYRGSAYNYNLKYRIPDHISIAFHNLSGHDAHLFIKELEDDIGAIAENKEKYIGFNVNINFKLSGVTNEDGKEVYKNIQLRFIHSCRFVASSLDKLDSNLNNDPCKNLRVLQVRQSF